jgi:hypothetical protein
MVSALNALRFMFQEAGFSSGSEFYVRADTAAAYLDACEQHGLVILGVEAFERRGDKLKPRLDLVADFSSLLDSNGDWKEAIAASHREALRFLAEVVKENSGLVINVAAVEPGTYTRERRHPTDNTTVS